jgi:hypothetical protein
MALLVIPDHVPHQRDREIRDPAQRFAEGDCMNIVAFGEASCWIPDTVPLSLHGSGMTNHAAFR